MLLLTTPTTTTKATTTDNDDCDNETLLLHECLCRIANKNHAVALVLQGIFRTEQSAGFQKPGSGLLLLLLLLLYYYYRLLLLLLCSGDKPRRPDAVMEFGVLYLRLGFKAFGAKLQRMRTPSLQIRGFGILVFVCLAISSYGAPKKAIHHLTAPSPRHMLLPKLLPSASVIEVKTSKFSEAQAGEPKEPLRSVWANRSRGNGHKRTRNRKNAFCQPFFSSYLAICQPLRLRVSSLIGTIRISSLLKPSSCGNELVRFCNPLRACLCCTIVRKWSLLILRVTAAPSHSRGPATVI